MDWLYSTFIAISLKVLSCLIGAVTSIPDWMALNDMRLITLS
jgi:hypothetical protein